MAKKSFENVIGKIIYGTLLFMPLVSILARTMYVVCNKNAYESYSSSQSPNTYLSEETINNLEENKIYQFTTNNELYLASSQIINVDQLVMIKNPTNYTGLNKNATMFEQYINQNGYFIHIRYSDNSNDYLKYANVDTTYVSEIQFNFVSHNTTSTFTYTNWTKEIVFGEQQSLDNVFEYSIYQVEQSQYYNWTTNTAIYSVVHNTTTTLQINNSFVDLLLTYWMLMTVIYVIYDIALIMLQLAHKKVHEIIEK